MIQGAIGEMEAGDLASMDLKSFFEAYEKSLKSLVGSHRREAEDAKTDLSKLRKAVAKLLAELHPVYSSWHPVRADSCHGQLPSLDGTDRRLG